MKIFHKKYLLVLSLFLIGALIISLGVWFLSPRTKEARQLKKGLESFNKAIKEEEQKYAADIYGGITPEETYQKFLENLRKQDIDLASKYFILDKQDEYKKLLTEIKNSGQWDNMMKDLLAPENQNGKMDGNDYVIEVINQDNVSVTTIIITKPILTLGTEKKELSNIWKIFQF